MSNSLWWMDLTPYPGPDEHETVLTLHDAVIQVGRQAGKYFYGAQVVISVFDEVAGETYPNVESVLEAFARMEAEDEAKKIRQIPGKHGPRNGPTFDKRGRRRF